MDCQILQLMKITFLKTLCCVCTWFLTSVTLNNFYYFASLISVNEYVLIEKALVVLETIYPNIEIFVTLILLIVPPPQFHPLFFCQAFPSSSSPPFPAPGPIPLPAPGFFLPPSSCDCDIISAKVKIFLVTVI